MNYIVALLMSSETCRYALINSSISSILVRSSHPTTEQSFTTLERSSLRPSHNKTVSSNRLPRSMTAFRKNEGYFMHIRPQGLGCSSLFSRSRSSQRKGTFYVPWSYNIHRAGTNSVHRSCHRFYRWPRSSDLSAGIS